MMSELGTSPKLRFWAKMRKKRTRKIGLQRIQLLSHEPLRTRKKNNQAFESLNSDIRARTYAQITILGEDEPATDAQNRTSTNLASQLTSPL